MQRPRHPRRRVRRTPTSLHNPSFAIFARQCGGYGVKVSVAEDLDRALATALAVRGPALVEVMKDPELV